MQAFSLGSFTVGLVLTAIGVAVLMLATFATALRLGRHSIVDVAWGLGFVVIAAVSFVASSGHGAVGVRLLLLAMTAAWGGRLALHIARRNAGAGEDPRYADLLAEAPPGHQNAFALRKVYLTQGVVMWFVSLPVQVGMYERAPLSALAAVGVLAWAVGLFFEAVGDAQLAAFKRDKANAGTVMDRGLWRYTRHPNYFGDACVWWGLFLVAAGQWSGALTVLSPVLMTFLLAKGTGAAMTESRMSGRPGFADYVRRTSGFLPRPPRGA